VAVIESNLPTVQKLEKIEAIIPTVLAGMTAREIGRLLGCSHVAITKSRWWQRNRKNQVELDRRVRAKRLTGIVHPHEEIDN
jgi:hypothetical protein